MCCSEVREGCNEDDGRSSETATYQVGRHAPAAHATEARGPRCGKSCGETGNPVEFRAEVHAGNARCTHEWQLRAIGEVGDELRASSPAHEKCECGHQNHERQYQNAASGGQVPCVRYKAAREAHSRSAREEHWSVDVEFEHQCDHAAPGTAQSPHQRERDDSRAERSDESDPQARPDVPELQCTGVRSWQRHPKVCERQSSTVDRNGARKKTSDEQIPVGAAVAQDGHGATWEQTCASNARARTDKRRRAEATSSGHQPHETLRDTT